MSGRCEATVSTAPRTVEAVPTTRIPEDSRKLTRPETVSSAVNQQQSATAEIAQNVEQAAIGTTEVSRNIGMVTEAASQARKDVVLPEDGTFLQSHEVRSCPC